MTSILTDEAIGFYSANTTDMYDFARAIEDAVIKRLATGVSVEPVKEVLVITGPSTHKFMQAGQWYYSHDQLTTAIAAARVQSISDAMNCYSPDDSATDWIDKLRALLGKEST